MSQKVTSNEAKNKWCRHGRQFHNRDGDTIVTSAAINRDKYANGTGNTTCFGSGCMAWGWDEEGNVLKGLKEGDRKGFCDAETGDGKIAIM